MESEEPPPLTPSLCKTESGGSNDGSGEIVRSGDRRRKRRFSAEQQRSLECTFKAQARLEPRRMAELAGELGLQPRQVAVWFQNRRARGKLKQVEREFDALRADYDALLTSFDALNSEKQSLATQLKKLEETLEMTVEQHNDGGECFIDGGANDEQKGGPGWLSELMVCSAEEELADIAEWPDLRVSEPVDGSVAPAGRRCSDDDAGGVSNLCCGGSSLGWWEPIWAPDE